MKRTHIVIAILIGLATLSTQFGIFEAVVEFMFLGMIPGTTITLPFWLLGSFYLLVGIAGIIWISAQPLYIGDYAHQDKVARALARKRVTELAACQEKPATQRAQYGAQTSEINA